MCLRFIKNFTIKLVHFQDSEEFDTLHRVSLNWSSLRHSASTDLEIAETTRAFWEGNSLPKLAVSLFYM